MKNLFVENRMEISMKIPSVIDCNGFLYSAPPYMAIPPNGKRYQKLPPIIIIIIVVFFFPQKAYTIVFVENWMSIF